MRKITLLVLAVLIGFAAQAQAPSGYYNGTTGLSGSSLKAALHGIIDGHTEYPYTSSSTDTWDILKDTDRDPNNANNVIGLYSRFSMNGPAEYDGGNGWTREHVWAKSRGDFGTSLGAGTDVHHLRPEDASVNSARSNRNFDDVPGETGYYDGSGQYSGLIPAEQGSDFTWEPGEAQKGDVARMLFYMAVRYEGTNGEPDLELQEAYLDQSSKAPYHSKLSTLIQWHNQDPVDQTELDRNDVIYSYQGNRNPFIDHPEWVESIFGSCTGDCTPGSGDGGGDGGSGGGDGGSGGGGGTPTGLVSASFESNDTWGYTASPAAFTVGSDIWDEVSSLSSISPADGSTFWGVRDLQNNNGGTSGWGRVSFEDVDISGYTDVEISFEYYAIGYDSGDKLGYELFVDGAGQGIITIQNGGSSGGWVTETVTVPAGTNTVSIDLMADQNGGSDYAGFDNLAITGTDTGGGTGGGGTGGGGTGGGTGAATDLIISEYVEGSSYNKAIELYNGTSGSINLSGYQLRLYSNGNSSPNSTYSLSGTLASGAAYVVSHGSASFSADATSSGTINFNGDDYIELVYNGTLVDGFGVKGSDPGSYWSGGGVQTQNRTLRRKSSVTSGDTNATDAFDPSAEWEVFSQDDFSGLGSHTMDSPVALATDLFMSEYVEGSSYNKAIEIYNGTGASVNLSGYQLRLYSNGNSSPNSTYSLSGTIADGDAYVVKHGSASFSADATSSNAINFNGDDYIELVYNGTLVDGFGVKGTDPGSYWSGGGVQTQNRSLRRKASVTGGDTNATDAFDPSTEWEQFNQDDFSGLGSHTMGGSTSNTELTFDAPALEQTVELGLYPNPTYGTVTLQVSGAEEIAIAVYDLQGRMALQAAGSVEAVNAQLNEAMAQQSAGLYLVQVSYNGTVETLKLIKR